MTISVPDRNRNRRHGGAAHDTDLTVTRVDLAHRAALGGAGQLDRAPTFMGAEDMLFSGGWPGHLQRTLEALIGQGVTVMFYNGAEGDQSPVPPPIAAAIGNKPSDMAAKWAFMAWRAWEKVQPQP